MDGFKRFQVEFVHVTVVDNERMIPVASNISIDLSASDSYFPQNTDFRLKEIFCVG